jgi:hypothetical protein
MGSAGGTVTDRAIIPISEVLFRGLGAERGAKVTIQNSHVAIIMGSAFLCNDAYPAETLQFLKAQQV